MRIVLKVVSKTAIFDILGLQELIIFKKMLIFDI